MTVNVLDVIDATVNKPLLRKVAFQLSEPAPNTTNAFHGAVHALLGGLMKRAQYRDGAEQVAAALHGFNSDVLANVEGLVSGGELDSLAKIGTSLTDSVFESQLDVVVDAITKNADVRRNSTVTLVGLAAPVVFGALGHEKQSQSLNAVGMRNLLVKQRRFLGEAANRELMKHLALDDLLDPIPQTSSETVDPAKDEQTAVVRKPSKKKPRKRRKDSRVLKIVAVLVAFGAASYGSWRWLPISALPFQSVASEIGMTATHEDVSELAISPIGQEPSPVQASNSPEVASADVESTAVLPAPTTPSTATLEVARVVTDTTVETNESVSEASTKVDEPDLVTSRSVQVVDDETTIGKGRTSSSQSTILAPEGAEVANPWIDAFTQPPPSTTTVVENVVEPKRMSPQLIEPTRTKANWAANQAPVFEPQLQELTSDIQPPKIETLATLESTVAKASLHELPKPEKITNLHVDRTPRSARAVLAEVTATVPSVTQVLPPELEQVEKALPQPEQLAALPPPRKLAGAQPEPILRPSEALIKPAMRLGPSPFSPSTNRGAEAFYRQPSATNWRYFRPALDNNPRLFQYRLN